MKPGGLEGGTLAMLGLLAGLAQVVAGVAMYLAGVYFAPWSMAVSLVVLLLCIVFAVRWYTRTRLAGTISYRQALTIGMAVSAGTGIVYAAYNLVSIGFFYPHFLDDFAAAIAARSTEPVQTIRAGLSAPGIAIPNLIRLTIFGTVLSAICALVLRTSRQ